jgi:hypothetical protein
MRLTCVESDTRRQAATEFTRALMEHFERDVTDIIKGYIATFLQVSIVIWVCVHLIRRNTNPTPVASGSPKTPPFTFSRPSPREDPPNR